MIVILSIGFNNYCFNIIIIITTILLLFKGNGVSKNKMYPAQGATQTNFGGSGCCCYCYNIINLITKLEIKYHNNVKFLLLNVFEYNPCAILDLSPNFMNSN